MITAKISQKIFQAACRLLLACLLCLPPSLIAASPPVQAAQPHDLKIPGVKLVVSFIARTQTYRTAGAYSAARDAYADRLHAKAQEMLAARQVNPLRRSQVAAFVKVIALIEGERKAAITFTESEKKAAHDAFARAANDTLLDVMLSTGAAQKVLSTMVKGLDASKNVLDTALDHLSGGRGGVLAEIEQVRSTAGWVALGGEIIGGRAGSRIRATANRVVSQISRPQESIRQDLEQASSEIQDLRTRVSEILGRGKRPGASETVREGLIRAAAGEAADPAIEALVDVLSGKRGDDFRTRARAALTSRSVARCAAIGARYREVIFRLQLAGSQPETLDTLQAPTCQVIDVEALAQGEAEQASAPPAPPPTATLGQSQPAASPTQTTAPPPQNPPPAQPTQPAAPPATQIEQACDLMPSGGALAENNTDRSCFASFSDQPGARTISINIMNRIEHQLNACQSMGSNSDYHTVTGELDLGVCGYQLDTNYQGKKVGGYTGWSIFFVLDLFSVRVSTNQEYPANKEWVESTAQSIEAQIQSYIEARGE